MATTAELLSAVETAIQARLNGDAYQAYSQAGKRFEGASLKDLFAIRTELRRQAAEEENGNFFLAEPFEV